MNDPAFGAEGHGNGALSAKHMLRAEMLVEDVEMVHAVEQRQDCGAGSDRRREGFDCIIERIGLAAHKDQIEGAIEAAGQHRRGLGPVKSPNGLSITSPSLASRRRAARAPER